MPVEITKIAAEQLIDELTKSKIVVTFDFDTILAGMGYLRKPDDSKEDYDRKKKLYEHKIYGFTININNQFISHVDDPSTYSVQGADNKYATYINDLRTSVKAEIEKNINLRIGKWEILDYLTFLETELKEIRKNFKFYEEKIIDYSGERTISPNDPFEMDLFSLYDNRNIPIETISDPPGNPFLMDKNSSSFGLMKMILSRYWDHHINVIDSLLRFIEPRKKVIEVTNDYVKVIDIVSNPQTFNWTRTDTDLLELIIALFESGAIQNTTRNLTQKEAIQIFSDFFGKEIKDQYKKLNAARNRKKEDPGFIIKLQQALDNYYQKLDERL